MSCYWTPGHPPPPPSIRTTFIELCGGQPIAANKQHPQGDSSTPPLLQSLAHFDLSEVRSVTSDQSLGRVGIESKSTSLPSTCSPELGKHSLFLVPPSRCAFFGNAYKSSPPPVSPIHTRESTILIFPIDCYQSLTFIRSCPFSPDHLRLIAGSLHSTLSHEIFVAVKPARVSSRSVLFIALLFSPPGKDFSSSSLFVSVPQSAHLRHLRLKSTSGLPGRRLRLALYSTQLVCFSKEA